MNEDQQQEHEQGARKKFLPLGSVVILKGSVKKLVIVSRGTVVENVFFDYGAFLYPEGMVDSKVAYFDHDSILKVVHEGYSDADDALVLDILNDAYAQFRAGGAKEPEVSASVPPAASAVPAPSVDDLFASVRDLGDDADA